MNIFLDIDDTLLDYNEVEKTGGYSNVSPLPGVSQFITKVQQAGHKVYVISWTNGNKESIKEKYEWCLRNIPTVPYENIAIIPRPSNKAKKAMEMLNVESLTNQDLLIDDNPDNIEQWREAGGAPFQIDIKNMNWENF